MKVLVLTGMPGSGKSAAVQVAKKLGIPVYRMGDVVWEEVEARGHKLGDSVVGTIATEMRNKHGPAIWADRTIDKVKEDPRVPLIIIDGCRSKAEVDAFRHEWGEDLVLVAIYSSDKTRFHRLTSRGREDDIKTLEEFEERDARELKWGLDRVIKEADRTLENEGPVENLHKEVQSLLKEFSEKD